MKRSIGVTISAITVLIGSLIWLPMSLLALVIAVIGPLPPEYAPSIRYGNISFAIFLVLCSVWGLWTSVGLFRLKHWARVSLLLFASSLVYIGAMCFLAIVLVPMAPQGNLSSQALLVLRAILSLVFSLPFVTLGGWWLCLFNKPSIKAQFTTAMASRRPASITIIAILLFWMTAYVPFAAFFQWSVAFLGVLVTGWAATLAWTIHGVLSLWLGVGLLKLHEFARKLTIVYMAYWILSMLLFVILPDFDSRVASLTALDPSQPAPFVIPQEMASFMAQMMVLSIVPLYVVQLWFLIRCKSAFAPADG